jgi:arsenate reductase
VNDVNPARVLFLCTGNSARSQMAEALLRTLSQGQIDCFSAGTHPRPVHPLAIKVMAEIGIDISAHTSKSLERYLEDNFDFVISVCARAAENCPSWPLSRDQIRWSIDDPAEVAGTEEERLAAFRRIRTELRHRLGLFMLANKLASEVRLT